MKIALSQIDKLSKEMRRSICFNILTPKAQTTTKSTGNKDNPFNNNNNIIINNNNKNNSKPQFFSDVEATKSI